MAKHAPFKRLLLVLLLPGAAWALPDAPQPKPIAATARVRYWDRWQRICAQAVAFTAGQEAVAVAASYWLHRTGHRRLARIPELLVLQGNIRGAWFSLHH